MKVLGSCTIILVLPLFATLCSAEFTQHFRTWLKNNDYDKYNFERADIGSRSFGGKNNGNYRVINQPVIFIHGTTSSSDIWNSTREYLQSEEDYKISELYATTWGQPDPAFFNLQHHSKVFVLHIRKFIEAVIKYTGAKKVDVVAHSMGVTLSRKAIKGGKASENGTEYNVGKSLTDYIDTYVGITAVNLGVNDCALNLAFPACNIETGAYPGIMKGTAVLERSKFLEDLLQESGYEGSFRYSMYSLHDELISNNNLVYCQRTSRIPGQTGEIVFNSKEFTHRNAVILTADLVFSLIKHHVILPFVDDGEFNFPLKDLQKK